MDAIDIDARARILELQERIIELQSFAILAIAETKALQEMAILIWESQKVRVDAKRKIPTVLESMRSQWVEKLLSSFADLDMKIGSQLRENIENILKSK